MISSSVDEAIPVRTHAIPRAPRKPEATPEPSVLTVTTVTIKGFTI
jgi:hypothetical protein